MFCFHVLRVTNWGPTPSTRPWTPRLMKHWCIMVSQMMICQRNLSGKHVLISLVTNINTIPKLVYKEISRGEMSMAVWNSKDLYGPRITILAIQSHFSGFCYKLLWNFQFSNCCKISPLWIIALKFIATISFLRNSSKKIDLGVPGLLTSGQNVTFSYWFKSSCNLIIV